MIITKKRYDNSLTKTLLQKFDPLQDQRVYLSQLHSMTQSLYTSLLQLSSDYSEFIIIRWIYTNFGGFREYMEIKKLNVRRITNLLYD